MAGQLIWVLWRIKGVQDKVPDLKNEEIDKCWNFTIQDMLGLLNVKIDVLLILLNKKTLSLRDI